MKRFAGLLAGLSVFAALPAHAQLVQFLAADGSNRTTVTAGEGMPSTAGANSALWSYAAATAGIVNTTTAVTIKAASGAGIRSYLSGLQLQSEALGAATELAIRDGAAGTVIWRTKIGTAGIGLSNVRFDPPLRSTANTLLEVVTLTASTTGAVYVNAQGFTAP